VGKGKDADLGKGTQNTRERRGTQMMAGRNGGDEPGDSKKRVGEDVQRGDSVKLVKRLRKNTRRSKCNLPCREPARGN